MSTKEEKELLRRLVQHVSRAFYEPKFTIIMDQLSRYPALKEDDLAGKMGLQPKELNKVIAVLHSDRLVEVHRQNELREGAQRAVAKSYYYLDYEHFCNVVKWRIAKMHRKIDSTLRNELDNKGYLCPQCKTSYVPLDVDRLMDLTLGALICEICHAEVIDNEDIEHAQGNNDRMQRFNHQMRFIRAGLQKSESMVLPAFDIVAYIQSVNADNQQKAQPGAGLKIAGSDPNKKQDDGVGIVISTDKDEVTRKLERDAEAALKRQQNALPAWHLKSTISGDLTALGIKESERAEAANNALLASSNEDILKGLGVIGGGRVQPQQQDQVNIVQETKPIINPEADYYDHYYASLAASHNVSAIATPIGPSTPGIDGFEDEEEDRKPSVEYLNSLNDYRKRSRSREDEGPADRTKLAKTSEPSTPLLEQPMFVDEAPDVVTGDDPMVSVDGKMVPFSEITEEHHELMTADEYTAYFKLLEERS